MMKLYLGFLVICLAASALGNNSCREYTSEVGGVIQHEENPNDCMLSGQERRMTRNVHECIPGEQLEVNDWSECWEMHFKGCQIWVAPKEEAKFRICERAIFEDCYVNMKGLETARNATYIRSVVEVYDNSVVEIFDGRDYSYPAQSNQTPFATAIDSIVTCFPATYKYDRHGDGSSLNFYCNHMTFEGHSAFNIPTGAIYQEESPDPDSLIHTKNYAFCYGGADAPECTNYLYYNPNKEDPRYEVKATSDRSCCLSSVEDDRVCLSTATKCEELDFCSRASAVNGGLELLSIHGIGKRFNAVLTCLMTGENDCYLEACRHENGCGKEWNFFALVNDTMMPELQGVKNAWKSVIDIYRQSDLADYLHYCSEVDNSCKEFGHASIECYQTRANAFAPNSVNDPRSVVYTDINLELKLKARQKSTYIQDFNDGHVDYPKIHYMWKNVTIETMSTFLQAQRMLRSLSDETVIKGKELLDELDETLQALILVTESELHKYTSYHGILLQLMALVRGYSLQPPPLPSSGLLLPLYSADFLLGQFRHMKEDMTYEALSDKLTDVITTVNEATLTLLSVNAQQLTAEGSAAHVELDLAINELGRAKKQMTEADSKTHNLNSALKKL